MSLRPYESYKESAAERLGLIPVHWDVKPLKRVGDVFPSNVDKKAYEGETLVRLCNYTDVYYRDRITADIAFMEATASPAQIEKFSLRAGDTLVTKDSETADDIGIAAYVPDDLPGVICGYHLAVVRSYTGTCGAFVKWLFDSSYVRSRLETEANGLTRVGLSQYALDNLAIPLPPEPEQADIAAFLDREAAKLDALIAEQHRLIDLLKEKSKAVVSHAVTKGLNKFAAMKDSGIEWLGMVPQHWVPKRLGRLFRQQKRQGFQSKEVLSVYRDYGVIRKDSRTDNYNKTPDDLTNYQLVEPGDLVVNKMKAWQGSLGISDLEGITSPDYVVFSPIHEDFPLYLHLLLRSQPVVSTYLSISNGIRLAQWRLEPDAFLSLSLFFPTADEQRSIADAITKRTREIDELIAESNTAIVLLQERRTALISAAVTGKIDVRGLQASAREEEAAA